MATTVAHNPADLFALQVAIDAGHPGVDLGEQQPLVGFDDVIGPGFRGLGRRLDAGHAVVACVADQRGDPVGGVFHRTREVAEASVRAHHHHQIREPIDQNAQQRHRPVGPFVLQRRAPHPLDVDLVECPGDRVETGRVDDHVELVIGARGADTVRRDALDRRFGQFDQFNIRLGL